MSLLLCPPFCPFPSPPPGGPTSGAVEVEAVGMGSKEVPGQMSNQKETSGNKDCPSHE